MAKTPTHKRSTSTISEFTAVVVSETIAQKNGKKLLESLKLKKFDEAHKLVHEPMDTSITDDEGNTALHLSVITWQWNIVGYILLADTGSITAPNKFSKTPLDLIKEIEARLFLDTEEARSLAKKAESAIDDLNLNLKIKEVNLKTCQNAKSALEKLSGIPLPSTRKLSDSLMLPVFDDSSKEGKLKESPKSKSSISFISKMTHSKTAHSKTTHSKTIVSSSESLDLSGSGKSTPVASSSPLSPILTESNFLNETDDEFDNEKDFGRIKVKSSTSSKTSSFFTTSIRIDAGEGLVSPESVVIHTPPRTPVGSKKELIKKSHSWSSTFGQDYVYGTIDEGDEITVIGESSVSS